MEEELAFGVLLLAPPIPHQFSSSPASIPNKTRVHDGMLPVVFVFLVQVVFLCLEMPIRTSYRSGWQGMKALL